MTLSAWRDLTERERQIMMLLAAGRSTKQVARELRIARSTVDCHIANVKAKTGASGPLHRLVVGYVCFVYDLPEPLDSAA